MALRTITPEHRDLRHISITVPYHQDLYNASSVFEEEEYKKWLDLDRLLVQLWESRSIRPEVICTRVKNGEQGVRDSIGRLFPEITSRGIVDLGVLCASQCVLW